MHNSAKSDAISNEFHNFLADMEALLKETANLSGDELTEAREKIQQRVASAKESAVNLGGELADGAGKVASAANKMANAANREVHAEPWKAIGAGAVVGLLFGLLFSRR